ncbi:MAG: TolC family protein [Victivallales bacterium]|nr:TolC family protein [Victivallales bacterium]
MSVKYKLLFAVVVPAILLGCQGDDFYRKQREEAAEKHLSEIRRNNVAKDRVFTLSEAIDYALKNNLDLKVHALRESVQNANKYAEALKMLPEANVSLDLTHRNNENASQSIDVNTGDESLDFSRSSRRDNERFNVDIAFSAIDFGVSYLSAVQAQDRFLLEKQLERRASQNLMYDVAKAYFTVAATQDAMEKTTRLLARCAELDKLFDKMVKSGDISPLRLMDERKRFFRVEEALMQFRRRHAEAAAELKSLMGIAPDSNIKVDTAVIKSVDPRILELPNVYFLEKVALRERPELYQLDIQKNIISADASKTILTMFPNVKAFLDFTQDSNPYLYNHSWIEIGLRAAYNIARLPAKIAEYKAFKTEERELEVRTMALSFGVLSQVRVAMKNVDEVYKRYLLDDRIHRSYQDYYKTMEEQFKKRAGNVSQLDLDRTELEAVEAEIIRVQAIGNCYLSYFRLMNAVGLSVSGIEDANAAFAEVRRCLDREVPFCLGMNYVRDDGVIVYNGIEFDGSISENQRKMLENFAKNGYRHELKVEARPVVIDQARLVADIRRRIASSYSQYQNLPEEKPLPSKGEIRDDGTMIYNGVEVKSAVMSDAERAALDKLAR